MSKLIKHFESLKNDVERWKWLAENQGRGLRVVLDNDLTILIDEGVTLASGECKFAEFDNYVGWHDGVIDLLSAMGIEAEAC